MMHNQAPSYSKKVSAERAVMEELYSSLGETARLGK